MFVIWDAERSEEKIRRRKRRSGEKIFMGGKAEGK
jgi:hypothetical protein